jgi:FAD/FMN-containing dehydrogenase
MTEIDTMRAVSDRSYDERTRRLAGELRAARSPRLAKRTSNLFRPRAPARSGLDVRDFAGVLSVDPERRTADVQGMTTYEALSDATLRHGLMPLVVPELKTITIGGAVAGLGIESSSFRNGMPHESVLEMDVLTGTGEVVPATPDNEHAALFRGIPNSYGTLGYVLRLTIELESVAPYVRLRHVRHRNADAYFAEVTEVCGSRRWQSESVDFVDGAVFGPDELYLTLGTFEHRPVGTSDYTGSHVFYRSIRDRAEDALTVHDYLWRWDTDWFWCSRVFGVQHPAVRALVPKQYLRSDTYWRLIDLDRRLGLSRRLDSLRGRRSEAVIQDVQIPVDRAAEFLAFFRERIGIWPVWMCPVRQRDRAARWPLYELDPEVTYVNFGFWSSVRLGPGEGDGSRNRLIEEKVEDLGGRKSLYSTSFYREDEFWRLYNGEAYRALKHAYDPEGRFLDLYEKCVRSDKAVRR